MRVLFLACRWPPSAFPSPGFFSGVPNSWGVYASSDWDTSAIRPGPILMTSHNLDYLPKGHISRSGVSGASQGFSTWVPRDTVQALQQGRCSHPERRVSSCGPGSLVIVAKTWKQPKGPWTETRIRKMWGRPLCGTAETNLTVSVRMGVQPLASLSGSGIPCCRGCGVAGSCSSDSIPILGTSICRRP